MNTPLDTTIRIEPATGKPDRLFVLLHGVGANAAGLRPLGMALQRAFPSSVAVISDGISPFDGGGNGRQWFSVRGVTEENRPARVAAVLPSIRALVAAEQERYGIGAKASVLGGFSQGAILSLELALREDGLVGHVLSFSGRFAALPTVAPTKTAIHFLHGDRDPVIAVQHAQDGYARLQKLGGKATLDIAAWTGHELNESLVDKAIEHLRA